MKRYIIDIERYYGTGLYDGEEYADIRTRENKDGDWVRARDAIAQIDKMKDKIRRMQKRIDKHEGRA